MPPPSLPLPKNRGSTYLLICSPPLSKKISAYSTAPPLRQDHGQTGTPKLCVLPLQAQRYFAANGVLFAVVCTVLLSSGHV